MLQVGTIEVATTLRSRSDRDVQFVRRDSEEPLEIYAELWQPLT